MGNPKEEPITELRFHHICCVPRVPMHQGLGYYRKNYMPWGPDHRVVRKRLIKLMHSRGEDTITVVEGGDVLCRSCLLYLDNGCTSKRSGEDLLRKIDAAMLKELGLSLGTCLTVREWQGLIDQHLPFKYCLECFGGKCVQVKAKLS